MIPLKLFPKKYVNIVLIKFNKLLKLYIYDDDDLKKTKNKAY